MSYLIIAYPKVAQKDFELIQNFRQHHDELYFHVILPHFTFVFPVFNLSEKDFLDEVIIRVRGVHKINFILRAAAIQKDAFSDYYHTFLVPDEGFSQILKLHDKLYSGLFSGNLKLDIPYVPHIGIGNSKDAFKCKAMAEEWNVNDFAIPGEITALSAVNYTNSIVTTLRELRLDEG